MTARDTFFGAAIVMCILLIAFSLCITLILSLGAFPVNPEVGFDTSGDTNDLFFALSGFTGGAADLWALVITFGFGAAAVFAWAVKSAVPVGIYLFSAIYWTSFNKAIMTVQVIQGLPFELLIIFEVIALFIFIAGIIGLLTGGN